jgi:ApaG protein
VTHSGLLGMARRLRCSAITTAIDRLTSDPANNRWIFKATVYNGFVGYGDADPSNVSSLVHGAEMRVAETRAVNRALRKTYGSGQGSLEELGCPLTTPFGSIHGTYQMTNQGDERFDIEIAAFTLTEPYGVVN